MMQDQLSNCETQCTLKTWDPLFKTIKSSKTTTAENVTKHTAFARVEPCATAQVTWHKTDSGGTMCFHQE